MKPAAHKCRACNQPRKRFAVVPLSNGGFRVVCLDVCFGKTMIAVLRQKGAL